MKIPTPLNPLGRGVVTLGPYSEDEMQINAPIGGMYSCETLTSKVLMTVASSRIGGSEKNPVVLFALDPDYDPLTAKSYLAFDGDLTISFFPACKPKRISINGVHIATGRSLVFYTVNGVELARRDGPADGKLTLELTADEKLDSIIIHAVSNIWFNGISLEVEI